MRLHVYRGLSLRDENIPRDVTHVIVDDSVTVIKSSAFIFRQQLVSVAMTDKSKVIEIEMHAFSNCISLKYVRLAKALKYIGTHSFASCHSLEVLVIPETVKRIDDAAFICCISLNLPLLVGDINLEHMGQLMINTTPIHDLAKARDQIYYEWTNHHNVINGNGRGHGQVLIPQSSDRVNRWLLSYMDEYPLHKLCCNANVAPKMIHDFLRQHGSGSALHVDTRNGMYPLHFLAMNPHAPAEVLFPLFFSDSDSDLEQHEDDDDDDDDDEEGNRNRNQNRNHQTKLSSMLLDTAIRRDNHGSNPLHYAKEYNVGILVALVLVLCNHRNSTIRQA